MSAAKPTGESLAAELESRRPLHNAVDDLRAPFDQSDAGSAIPDMRRPGSIWRT